VLNYIKSENLEKNIILVVSETVEAAGIPRVSVSIRVLMFSAIHCVKKLRIRISSRQGNFTASNCRDLFTKCGSVLPVH
jgi:hypothetical protein